MVLGSSLSADLQVKCSGKTSGFLDALVIMGDPSCIAKRVIRRPAHPQRQPGHESWDYDPTEYQSVFRIVERVRRVMM